MPEGAERVALGQATHRVPNSASGAVRPDCFGSISRTGRQKAASGQRTGAESLVRTDQSQQNSGRQSHLASFP